MCACICNIINVLRRAEKSWHDAQGRWHVWSRERAHDKLAIIFFKFKTLREIPEPHWINVQPIRHSVCWFQLWWMQSDEELIHFERRNGEINNMLCRARFGVLEWEYLCVYCFFGCCGEAQRYCKFSRKITTLLSCFNAFCIPFSHFTSLTSFHFTCFCVILLN